MTVKAVEKNAFPDHLLKSMPRQHNRPYYEVKLDSLDETARNVARLLSIHINTVRWWTNLGILRTYRDRPRGDRRYRQEDIASFL